MIPEQLKDCKFCKVGSNFKVKEDKAALKRPFESAWQNKHYDLKTAEEWLETKNECINYGVLTGLNQLAILDDDTPNNELHALYDKHFQETFQARGHYYFRLLNWNQEKIEFNNRDKLYPGPKQEKEIVCCICGTIHKDMTHHMGELLGKGQQGVGPGSSHPDGTKYEVVRDLPIQEIEFDKFISIFGDYVIKKEVVIRDHKPSTWQGDDIKDVPIGSIISFNGLKDVGGSCYQGPHPVHGSSTGMNFRVDTMNNTWVCFHGGHRPPHGGGGPAELIAVVEGIIDCGQAGSNCFTADQGREVIEVARRKYGLKAPEPKEDSEPKGWGRVLDIQKVAEKNGITNCPQCHKPFQFNSSKGWFACTPCGLYGGLKKLLKLKFLQEAVAQ